MRNAVTVLILGVAIGAAAPSLWAGGSGEHAGKEEEDAMNELLDEDVLDGDAAMRANDGERAAWAQKMQREFDRDGDGALDDAEREQGRGYIAEKRARGRAERFRKQFDADRDGSLSASEEEAMQRKLEAEARSREEHRASLLEEYDGDGDGRLDSGERNRLRQEWKERAAQKHAFQGGKADQGDDPAAKQGKDGKHGGKGECKDDKQGKQGGKGECKDGKQGKHGGKQGGHKGGKHGGKGGKK